MVGEEVEEENLGNGGEGGFSAKQRERSTYDTITHTYPFIHPSPLPPVKDRIQLERKEGKKRWRCLERGREKSGGVAREELAKKKAGFRTNYNHHHHHHHQEIPLQKTHSTRTTSNK